MPNIIYKKREVSAYETHVRRCPVCRVATTKTELCPDGLALFNVGGCMEKGLTKVITAELHKDLFLGGKNHGQRLDSSRFSDLVMFANEKQDRLYVTWKGFTKKLPMTNVADYTDEDCLVLDKKVDQSAAPQLAHISTSAQVETPMSHVHAGHGHGKTGVGGKIK